MTNLKLVLPAAFLVALAGCASTSSAPPAATTDAGANVATTPPTSDAGAGTGEDSTGGGSAGDFCLNTAEEVAAALQVEVATPTSFENEGLGGGCTYGDPDGAPVYAISVITNEQAASAFESYRATEGMEELSGIGEAAIFIPINELFSIAWTKGGVTYSVGPASQDLPLSDDPAALRNAVEDLARQAADRA